MHGKMICVFVVIAVPECDDSLIALNANFPPSIHVQRLAIYCIKITNTQIDNNFVLFFFLITIKSDIFVLRMYAVWMLAFLWKLHIMSMGPHSIHVIGGSVGSFDHIKREWICAPIPMPNSIRIILTTFDEMKSPCKYTISFAVSVHSRESRKM